MPEIIDIKGVGPVLVSACEACGFDSLEKLAGATAGELSAVPGVGEAKAASLIAAAQALLDGASADAGGKANGAAVGGMKAKKAKKDKGKKKKKDKKSKNKSKKKDKKNKKKKT